MNPDCTDIRSNEAGRALFGGGNRNLSQSATEADRPDFDVYSDEKIVPAHDLPMQRAALTGQPVQAPECELRFHNGTVKFIRGKAVPIFGQDGKVRGSIGVFIDITESRSQEQRLALLTEETKHRAKNTLALVLSIASLTLKRKLAAKDYAEFEGRLVTIGESLDVLVADTGPAPTVKEVICSTIKRQIGSEIARVKMTGQEILVPLQAITPLSMALHELTTNACKYGALSVAGGSVSIDWNRPHDPNLLALKWIERGGPKVVAPSRKGFGSRLLAQVLKSPRGKPPEITFGEHGVEYQLYVDLV